MESADKSLKKTLGETGGLGTVATRADIIEKLFHSFMLEKRDQYIHLTSKGRQVLELAPRGLTSPELTAKWEQELSDIACGRAKKKDFEAKIRSYTADIVKDIAASSKTYRHDNLTGKKCSAASQETSATSQELASQAEMLNQMVQKFELSA